MKRFRLTQSKHDSWYIDRLYFGLFWFTIDVRTGLSRAIERLKELGFEGLE